MKALILLAALAAPALASAPPYFGNTINTAAGTATSYLSGDLCVAASSGSAGTCAVHADGRNGTLTAPTVTATQVNASTVTATQVNASTVTATLFNGGRFSGNAASASNLGGGAAGNVVYQSGVNTTAFLPTGTAGQFLVVGGASAPMWSSSISLSSVTVSSINVINTNGISVAGSVIFRTSYTASNDYVGQQAGQQDTMGLANTGLGFSACSTTQGTATSANDSSGSFNTCIGAASMLRNTTGYNDTAVGVDSLFNNTTGYQNTALGADAMAANTYGYNNVAVGDASLFVNQIGVANSVFGTGACGASTNSYNSCFGYLAMNFYQGDSGGNGQMTVFGAEADRNNLNGYFDAVVGAFAFYSNVTGYQNSAVGAYAGYNNSGHGNLFLGYNAGYNAVGSNQLWIDNGSNVYPLIYGDFSARTISVGPALARSTFTADGNLLVSNGIVASTITATTITATSFVGNAATASNVGGGGAGQILYQSAANATGMLAAGTAGQILVGGASAPAWSASPSITGLTTSGAVHISTGMTVSFTSNLAFTSAQTSFTPSASVTGSTVSFVVQGTTVACWLAASASNSALTDQIIIGIGVDGAVNKIAGTSSTIGVLAVNESVAGYSQNVSFPPIEFQVTAGSSHSFWLGVWTGAGTVTFQNTSSAIGQFGCREVPSR